MERQEYTFEGASPDVHEDAAVSKESTLVGDVTVEAGVTVWPGAVLRGDVAPVRLEEGTAIGDNAVLHGTTTETDALVGHASVLNDSHVGEAALVGFNTTLSDASIGARSLVAMGTVVPDGYEVPPDSFVYGMPARVTPLSERDIDRDAIFEAFSSGEYAHLTDGHEDLFR